jgi:hypothetical protein
VCSESQVFQIVTGNTHTTHTATQKIQGQRSGCLGSGTPTKGSIDTVCSESQVFQIVTGNHCHMLRPQQHRRSQALQQHYQHSTVPYVTENWHLPPLITCGQQVYRTGRVRGTAHAQQSAPSSLIAQREHDPQPARTITTTRSTQHTHYHPPVLTTASNTAAPTQRTHYPTQILTHTPHALTDGPGQRALDGVDRLVQIVPVQAQARLQAQ